MLFYLLPSMMAAQNLCKTMSIHQVCGAYCGSCVVRLARLILQRTCVRHPGLDELVQQAVWDGTAVPVVTRHAPQWLSFPHPVLQHLRGNLHKVCFNQRAAELCILSLKVSKVRCHQIRKSASLILRTTHY